MTDNKTRRTDASVEEFLTSVESKRRREDGFMLLEMMKEITKLEPAMWGPSIIGFGSYHYKYESGREGEIFLTGFSPRKQSLSLYIMDGFDGRDDLLTKLGKHRRGVSCLYVNKLADVNIDVLRELVQRSFEHSKSNSES